ncbi:agmatinase family protein [Reichenbachiella agariperforans]|uniref:Agmatinase n=1 Tax=Reichenbachiella agariperforans TaxID=156994 RepID=A0A1M6LA48_REIAG|nr:agmatinase family protein [Reichenbachiella agariperforans]MBU2913847.1 agmatinase family protein [Reichenbachiella agariperforans]SHJ68044.1 agmatinase [Reichenbachiella agariperforans]
MSEKLGSYDPSAPGKQGTLFGLPFDQSSAEVVVYPVPWEVTVSYNRGTAYGPLSILEASAQLDLEVPNQEAPWKRGIWMRPIEGKVKAKSDMLRSKIEPYIAFLEGEAESFDGEELLAKVNKATESLRLKIKSETLELLSEGKSIGLLGGDHSCPLGYMDALAERYDDFGILQIDAHMDLRDAYEGFIHSHASIMYNALKNPQISKLVQVGIRDYCEEEYELVQESSDRIVVFFDQDIKNKLYEGESWKMLCDAMIAQLPDHVYVSFDIDGLRPELCPGTGTPVPGGIAYEQAIYLLQSLKNSGRKIIGFDLCEVAPQKFDQQWNANVGARLLYQLCGLID